MDSRYLPSLKKLQIRNYSLYPGDLNFIYNFVNGINLVIGGNGVGKTTFLNIIKYALIGLYKKDVQVKRREYRGEEKRYERRENLPYKYFFNRMDKSVPYNEQAEVILTFKIDKTTFEVTRSLHVPGIKKVVVKDADGTRALSGEIVSQEEYDSLFLKIKDNEKQIKNTLQGQYEAKVGEVSNHEFFDNIIFLVNDVLFFNESRKTIMWDSEIQNRLASKYFVDSKKDDERERAERDGKYFDSLARHKGEDIRAIRKIFDSIDGKDDKNIGFRELIFATENEKKAVEAVFRELERIEKDRLRQETLSNKAHSEINLLNRKLEDLETIKRKEEERLFASIFKKLTPKYFDYLKSLHSSGECPLCNNELPGKMFERIRTDDVHCMMCGNDIRNPELDSPKLNVVKDEIAKILNDIRIKEKEVIEIGDGLKKLDTTFQQTSAALNSRQSSLRRAEFAIQQHQSDNTNPTDSEFKAMSARINELTAEKKEAEEKSRKKYALAAKISEQIDEDRLETREKLSGIFNDFGSKFLGVPCELVYEDPDGEGKRYFPRIGGIERLNEEELSESQRFFIDQAFRMSVLNFFSQSASFFMCETPDSSLDISYEKNAAKIFLEYIKHPNELILTSNLNNSEFLDYLIEEAKGKINYINLLKIGRPSIIQTQSRELSKASNNIEKLIHGK